MKASRWLRGRALPEQDKLQVMADLLGVEPHALRFGGPVHYDGGDGTTEILFVLAFVAIMVGLVAWRIFRRRAR